MENIALLYHALSGRATAEQFAIYQKTIRRKGAADSCSSAKHMLKMDDSTIDYDRRQGIAVSDLSGGAHQPL